MKVEDTVQFVTSIVQNPNVPDLSLRQMAVFLVTNTGAEEFRDPQNGSYTVRTLSKKLGISKPAITRAADRLESDGLIKRSSIPEDRRLVRIDSTIKGQETLRVMFGASAGARSAA